MPEPGLTGTEPGPLAGGRVNPAALTLADAARLLTSAGGRPVAVEMLRAADARGRLTPGRRLTSGLIAAWHPRGETRPPAWVIPSLVGRKKEAGSFRRDVCPGPSRRNRP